jgi:diadenylate cyclase
MFTEILKLQSLAEIAILTAAYFAILHSIRGTRGAGILKGLLFFFVFAFFGAMWVADQLGLTRIKQVLQFILGGSSIAAIVIFAPEMRRALLRLAQSRILSPIFRGSTVKVVSELADAAARLAKNRIGALIAIERDVGLGEYIEKGVRVDAAVTSDLLETLFYPRAPLHDGAVIIQGERIAAAAVFLPLSEDENLAKSMGSRHRAALGLCEESDAVVIVVSEETGRISLCTGKKVTPDLDRDGLERELRELYERGTLLFRTKRLFAPASLSSMPAARPDNSGNGKGEGTAEAGKKEEKKEESKP